MTATERLREELLSRAQRDQAARAAATDGAPAMRAAMAIDAENSAWLERVVDEVGWPRRSLVGEEAARAAWLLAQHADRFPDFQRRCLGELERAVAAGEASRASLAYLTDRVLVNRGAPQRYGTQLTVRDGHYAPQLLEAPEAVDRRRAEAGLEPLADYLARVQSDRGPPAPTPVPCSRCRAPVPVWLPGAGETIRASCPACGHVLTVTGHLPRASGGDGGRVGRRTESGDEVRGGAEGRGPGRSSGEAEDWAE